MGQQVRCGRRRSHGAGALIAAVILVVAALIAAWTLLPRLFTPHETARTAEEAYCAAVSPDGARRTLTPDQAQNAALIANIAVTRGLPDHAATVAIATAMQESRLTNLDYGDLDSLGLFQQRPSQGWGTAEQVSDMTYATNIFYDHLLQVPDWETIPVEDAAQEVQRSGYPELYATWDAMARAWASGLTGEQSAGVTCALEPATSSDANGLVAAISATLPNVKVSVMPLNGKTGTNNGAATNTASTTLMITLPDGLSADNRTRLCWQTAGWLVTQAHQYGIDALHADGMDWNRRAGTWTGTETAEQTVTVTLA
ncbi:cobalt transporter [Bifidobacterium longum subsp. longum]|uniref:cobalt transporter n=1 Tax=Bifidobacterium longum TaxID=216816 RepID=UPI00298C38A7|nr:cobalt transporter [Bifidobacterium longum]WPA88010.1 cobalt transporter [Bifidobacterium longum subsp. longum]